MDDTIAPALEWAREFHKRFKRDAQVRNSFVMREQESDPLPPATRLLRHRSRNALDLKLAVTYLWVAGADAPDPATGERHIVRIKDGAMAGLLGLEGDGQRSIAAARKRLADERLVSLLRRPGRSTQVTLLDERGTGGPYTLPGAKGGGGRYTRLNSGFWLNGWHLRLSGAAIVAMLALEAMVDDKRGRWISPSLRESRFGFSEDIWHKGTRELAEYGIVTPHRVPIRDPFGDGATYRYHYDLNLHVLNREIMDQQLDRLLREEGVRRTSEP